MWQAKIFTLYPEIFLGLLNKGIYGKAFLNKIWDLRVVDIRDATEDKHKTVDDTPYGGGPGMLIKADVLAKSIDQNKKEGDEAAPAAAPKVEAAPAAAPKVEAAPAAAPKVEAEPAAAPKVESK